MTDGKTDFPWVGQAFDPVVGSEYRVPDLAANYNYLRGRKGQCIDKRIGMSEVWATICFDDVYLDDEIIDPTITQTVRTSFLMPCNPFEKRAPLPIIEGEDPVKTKFARVWEPAD